MSNNSAVLLGRGTELDELRRRMAGLSGGGFSLVVQGGAGIGKTALLDGLGSEPDGGVQVLRATGSQHESELVFAGLGELLAPVLSRCAELPARQRAALRSALSQGEVAQHLDLEVFLAATELLALVSESAPVLCLVDDTQWLDAASVDALLFAAKRLVRHQIGFIFATREDVQSRLDTTSFARLALRPLDEQSAHALVRATNPELSSAHVEDVVAAAEGYPLALVEFAHHAATASWPAYRAPMPVSARIERVYGEDARALPAPAQIALLVLAASEQGSAQVILRALERLGAEATALDAVVDSGLVSRRDDQYVFCHPLARSAAYQSATLSQRLAAHRALAEVLAADHPELATWHRALGAVGADEGVAADLEVTALSARRRGGRLAEARALELAARLSGDRTAATRRLLAAGSAALHAGRHAWARTLLTDVARSTDLRVAADAEHLLAQIAFWQDGRVSPTVLDAAARVEALDPERAARLLSFALVPLISDCQVAAAWPIARRAWDLIGREMRPFEVAFRVAHVLVMAADPDAAALVEAAAAAATLARDVNAMIMISQPLWWLERYDAARRLLAEAIAEARASDAFWTLGHGLINQAELDRRTGRLAAAREAAAEALTIAEQLGEPMQRAEALVQLAATEAELSADLQARAHAEQALRLAATRSAGATELRLTASTALARSALTAGHPGAAVEQLRPLVERVIDTGVRDAAVMPGVGDLLEAYLTAGQAEETASLLTWLADAAERCDRGWARLAVAAATARRCPVAGLDELHAVLAADDGAAPLISARAWLAYGELVRRSGERGRAREALARADRGFRDAGAAAWYARTAAELRACGEPQPTAPGGRALTPQEDRIARLAATGARNREIALTLNLSEKTVETHLAGAYRKLGVRSRTELAARFPPT